MNTDEPDNKKIQVESVEQRLANLGYDWHSSDYFISPDETMENKTEKTPYQTDYYILGLCVEGWVEFYINHELLTIRPYCLFAAGPHVIIQKGRQSSNCKLRFLFFTKEFLLKKIINVYEMESFIFFSSSTKHIIQLEKKDTKSLLQLYDVLKNKRDKINSAYHLEIIRSLFFSFLYEAAAIFQKNNISLPKFTRDEDLNLKFRQVLVQTDKKKHNLKFYADSLFITPKYLIQAIKKSTGKTPGKLIDEAIIAEAKLLLRNRDHTIARVSESLQFSDQASFSKFFKKNTGITPISYHSGR